LSGLIWVPSWSYGSWIYNYICKQYLSSLTLWVQISLRGYSNMWSSLSVTCGRSVVFSGYDITEILLKVALNTINQNWTNINGWCPIVFSFTLSLHSSLVGRFRSRSRFIRCFLSFVHHYLIHDRGMVYWIHVARSVVFS
jgi:hypothetical protein